MAVHVELEPERHPGGNAQIAQAECFVDEVEIIMETLAGIVFEKGLAGFLVVSGPVTRAGFHG